MNIEEFDGLKNGIEKAGKTPLLFIKTKERIYVGRVTIRKYPPERKMEDAILMSECSIFEDVPFTTDFIEHLITREQKDLQGAHNTPGNSTIVRERIIKTIFISPEKAIDLMLIFLAERDLIRRRLRKIKFDLSLFED